MAWCKHGKESVVIRILPDLCHHQVEDGQGQPADEEDSNHTNQEPASSNICEWKKKILEKLASYFFILTTSDFLFSFASIEEKVLSLSLSLE